MSIFTPRVIDKIVETHKNNPELSQAALIKKLKLKCSPSAFSRLVKKLNEEGRWSTISDKVTNTPEEVELIQLAEKVKSMGESSKAEIMRKLGLTRGKLDKVLKFIVNSPEISARDEESITTSRDGRVVSVSKPLTKSQLIRRGEVFESVVGQTKALIAILNVGEKYVSIAKTLVESKNLDKGDACHWAFTGIANMVAYSNVTKSTFLKYKNCKSIGNSPELTIGAANLEEVESRAFEAPYDAFYIGKNQGVLSSVVVDKILNDRTTAVNNSRRSEISEIEDPEDDKPTIAEKYNQQKLQESRISKLTQKLASCPYRGVFTDEAITVYEGLTAYSVSSEEEEAYARCIEAIEAQNWNLLKEICSQKLKAAKEQVDVFKKYGFEVKGGYVSFNGGSLGSLEISNCQTILKRAQEYHEKGDENGVKRLAGFIEKLSFNPSKQVISRIVDFIKFRDIELDEEGNLIVFKIVNSDYKDCHTGTVNNSPGSRVRMVRTSVDHNERAECSQGLHVCALNYFGSFGGYTKRIVSCRLSPEDIVSIPADYNGSKIRCCNYTVIEDVTSDFLSGKLKADTVGAFR